MTPESMPSRNALTLALGAMLLAGCSGRESSEEDRSDAGAAPVAANVPAAQPPATLPISRPATATSSNITGPASKPIVTPEPASPALAVEGEGLRLFDRATGRARPIPFGTARAEVEALLASRGPPVTGTQADCGAGPLAYAAWPDGLKLYFQAGKLAGWALDGRAAGPRGPAIGTASGVGPGSSRAQLTDDQVATFAKTSLGTEFRSGEINGLLDGAGAEARITDMWAGASCVFR